MGEFAFLFYIIAVIALFLVGFMLVIAPLKLYSIDKTLKRIEKLLEKK